MYIAIAIAALLLIIVAILLIRNKKHQRKDNDDLIYNKILDGLGGKDNIVKMEAKMSRLNVELQNDSLISIDALKDAGVSRTIKMSNKVTLLLGDYALKIANKFNDIQ